MSTHEQQIAEERACIQRIRNELAEVGDVMKHSASIKGDRWPDSLFRSWQNAESAKTYAVQVAVRKVIPA